MARDVRVSARVISDVKKELEHIASEYGLTVSALIAYILGQWLNNQRVKSDKEPCLPTAAVNCAQGVPL